MMRTALIVIDMQSALIDSLPRPDNAAAVVERIGSLVERARAADAAVFFVLHEAAGTALEAGSAGWRPAQGLAAQDGEIVRKTTPDAFTDTGLETRLRAAGVERLVLCGYASEFCLDTSCRRAAALGFPVTLAADAHTTHDKPHAPAAWIRRHHTATLCELTSFAARITAVAADDIRFGAEMP